MTDAHYIGPLTDTANEAQAVLEIILDALANSGFEETPDRHVDLARLADIDPLVIEATARMLSVAANYAKAEHFRRWAISLRDDETPEEGERTLIESFLGNAAQGLINIQTNLWAIAQQQRA